MSQSTNVETTLHPVEVRLTGGMMALNRFLMTLQSKRMPVARFVVGRDGAEGGAAGGEVLRATILLDCPPETARRYATFLEGLEDVEEVRSSGGLVEVALVRLAPGGDWKAAAGKAGVEAHEEKAEGGEAAPLVVASGTPEAVEAWLGLSKDVEDTVRLGPVARPDGGGA